LAGTTDKITPANRLRLSAAGSLSRTLPGFAFPFSAKTAAAALCKHRATILSGGSRSKYGAIAFVRYRPRRPHLASTRCGARHLQPLRRSSEPEEEKHRAAAAARAWRGKGTRLAMAAARHGRTAWAGAVALRAVRRAALAFPALSAPGCRARRRAEAFHAACRARSVAALAVVATIRCLNESWFDSLSSTSFPQ